MRLYKRGTKESKPLLLYLPRKQSGFLCPPIPGGQTTSADRKRQAAKSDAARPSGKAPQQRQQRQQRQQQEQREQREQRQKHPARRKKETEVEDWLDTLEDEIFEALPAPAKEHEFASVPMKQNTTDAAMLDEDYRGG